MSPFTLPSLHSNFHFDDALCDAIPNFICGFNVLTINVVGFIVVSMLRLDSVKLLDVIEMLFDFSLFFFLHCNFVANAIVEFLFTV